MGPDGERDTRAGESSTPLHELVSLAREQGLAIDFAIYGGEHLDVYEGGARITGGDGDPMNNIAAGVRALKDRASGDKSEGTHDHA